jgi:hypothetical protein
VRRGLGLVCAVALLAGAAGCSGVPADGRVRVVRRVPIEGPEQPEARVIRHIARNPAADATPDQLVLSYLTAQGDTQNDHAIARNHLVADVPWNPGARAVVYASSRVGAPVQRRDRATVRVTFARVGTINPLGEFRPAPAATDVTFRLRRVENVGWRIAEAPAGVLLDRADLGTYFERVTAYFPDQARRLVPVQVFAPASEQPLTAAARALLAGPRGWIAPAVHTAVPDRTELLDPPTVVDGVVQLNFSREILNAPQEALGTLVAQLVWTLTEPGLGAVAVRVQAEGEPVAVPGRPGLRDHRRGDWQEYAPVPLTGDRRLFFLRNGLPYALDETGRLGRVAPGVPAVESFAVNRAGTRLAAVTRPSGGRQSLVVVDLTGARPLHEVLTADRITMPAWEPSGDVVWVAQTTGATQQVVSVAVGARLGPPAAVGSSLPSPASILRLSPDGARAALVVGTGAAASLLVARVERPISGAPVLADPLPVAPSVHGVTAVTFDGAGQLLFAAGTKPSLYRVDVDGFNLVPQRADGLPRAAVDALTAAAEPPAGGPVDRVVSAGGRLWRRAPGAAWAAALRGRGAAAAYAG